MCDSLTDLNKMLPFFAPSFVFNFYSFDVPFAAAVVDDVVLLAEREENRTNEREKQGKPDGEEDGRGVLKVYIYYFTDMVCVRSCMCYTTHIYIYIELLHSFFSHITNISIPRS